MHARRCVWHVPMCCHILCNSYMLVLLACMYARIHCMQQIFASIWVLRILKGCPTYIPSFHICTHARVHDMHACLACMHAKLKTQSPTKDRAQKVSPGGGKPNESFWKSQNDIKKSIIRSDPWIRSMKRAQGSPKRVSRRSKQAPRGPKRPQGILQQKQAN